MHSELLQKEHHHIYENFFAQHETVFSIPLCQNWSGDWDSEYEGLNIKQKIPLRMYIGIKRNNQPGYLHFGSLQFYNHTTKKFENRKIMEHLHYSDELHEYIVQYMGIEHDGYEFNRICETGRGLGLGFDGIFITSMIAGCAHIGGKHVLEEIDTIITTSIKFEQKIFYQHNNSYIAASLRASKYPIIQTIQGDKYSIDECTPEKVVPKLGLDNGLIYCGSPVLSEQIGTKSGLITSYSSKLQKHIQEKHNDLVTRFHEPSEGYMAAKTSISTEIYFGLLRCYLHKQSDTDITYLILSLNRSRYLQNIESIMSFSFSGLLNILLPIFIKKGLTPGLTYNDGSSSGGCVLFALPKEQLRNTLYEFLEDPKNIEAGICMIYSNREDGIETEGLKIEQDLSRGIYSRHIASHNYKLTKLGGECLIGDHDQLIKHSGLDIIFDKVHNKVYLMGQQTTSAQLCSQTATVELFDILIRHAKTRVNNKELPPSAYSKSRNEMYGKIIGPFVHLVHERCNKSLDLEMKGTGSQYSIKFGPANLTFGIIE